MVKLWTEGRETTAIAARLGVSIFAVTRRVADLRKKGVSLQTRRDHNGQVDWDEQTVARLRKLWSAGKSGTEIAREFRVTRNTIVGKAHRLGLTRDRAVVKANYLRLSGRRPDAPKPPRAPIVKRVAPALGAASQHRLRTLREAAEARPLMVCEELSATTDIFGLKDGVCRFPIGDPKAASFGYCGREADGERVYCALHCDRAYTGVPVDVKALTKLAKWFDGGGRRRAA